MWLPRAYAGSWFGYIGCLSQHTDRLRLGVIRSDTILGRLLCHILQSAIRVDVPSGVVGSFRVLPVFYLGRHLSYPLSKSFATVSYPLPIALWTVRITHAPNITSAVA